MKAYAVLGRASVFLAAPAFLFTLLLYLYPLFLGCSFPHPPKPSNAECRLSQDVFGRCPDSLQPAPFRLLALGDPQLEGDSSLPKPNDPVFPSLGRTRHITRTSGILSDITVLFESLENVLRRDIPRLLWSYRKRLDLLGNDYYLAHIYRTLHWWLTPTHVTVLGDLIGSQWVTHEEFERRGSRFWNTVFGRGRRVEDSIADVVSTEALGQDPAWSERVINVAGNHDIGYAGDLDRSRLERFERVFGKVNWDVKFQLAASNSTVQTSEHSITEAIPELHVVVLNNMNLDGPVFDPHIQKETFDFINSRVIPSSRPVEDKTSATILLTHIPLRKDAGVCTDGPLIYYGERGVSEQNHLSESSSKAILEGIFGMGGRPDAPTNGLGRNGVVLTGHDHEGCDVYHYILPEADPQPAEWKALKWEKSDTIKSNNNVPGLREITVRSMMGSFGGNAGLLSAWFDHDASEWRFEYATCPLGVQHVWWAVHVLDLITLACGATAALLVLREKFVFAFKKPSTPVAPQAKQPLLKPNSNGTSRPKRSHRSLGRKRSKAKM